MLAVCYGTLKQGYNNHRVLSSSTSSGRAVKVADGVVHGYELYDSGFPVAAASDDGSVVVEVYEVDTLERLDMLEGFPHMYLRKEIEVDSNVGKITGWMYYGNPRCWDYSKMQLCDHENGLYNWGHK